MHDSVILTVIVIYWKFLLGLGRTLNFIIRKYFNMQPVEEDESHKKQTQYVFRPYEIVKVPYKSATSGVYPTPRSGHRAVCVGGDFYCLGGFNPDQVRPRARRQRMMSLFQELWAYNFASGKWYLSLNYLEKDMPEELASNAVTAKNNFFIAYGGTGYPFGEACSNKCYVFGTNPSSVIKINANGEHPTPMYGPAIVVHENFLYTIGGTTGYQYSCDVHRLNLLSREWELVYDNKPHLRDDPAGRYRHEIVYTGDLIYVLGGGTAENEFDLETLPAFDIENKCWIYVKTKPDPRQINDGGGYPAPRKCYSCVQYDTGEGIEAVIAGGYAEDTFFSDVWKLNLKSFQWNLLETAKLPRPIYFHSAATPGNGCMYLFGGIEIQESLNRTNSLYKMWATVPKLSEICWDAINYYHPNLYTHPRNNLIKIGIPREFLKRLPSNTSQLAPCIEL